MHAPSCFSSALRSFLWPHKMRTYSLLRNCRNELISRMTTPNPGRIMRTLVCTASQPVHFLNFAKNARHTRHSHTEWWRTFPFHFARKSVQQRPREFTAAHDSRKQRHNRTERHCGRIESNKGASGTRRKRRDTTVGREAIA